MTREGDESRRNLRRPAWLGVSWRVHVANVALIGGVAIALYGAGSMMDLPPEEIFAASILLPLGALLLALSFPILIVPHDRAFMARVVLGGILIRLGLALFAHSSLPTGFFAPDQFTYQDVGWRTLLFLRGEGFAPVQISGTLEVGYYYWNAFLFSLFGFAPLAPKLVNCFVGSLAGIMAYRIAGGLGGREPALNAAVLATYFPSLILWSTQNLRDAPVVLLLTVIFWLTLRLKARPAGHYLVAALGALALLTLLRDYLAVMVLMTLLGSFVISPKQRLVANLLVGALLFGAAVFAYQRLGFATEIVESASFENLQVQRDALTSGGSAFVGEADLSSPLRSLQFLPVGLAFFLLAPFPWQLGSLLSIMTLPEMVIWYTLLPLVALGGLHLVRTRFSTVEPILLFLLLTGAVYALVEGNAGTAYRHRAQLIVFFLILAAVGLDLWRERRLRKRKVSRGKKGRLRTDA